MPIYEYRCENCGHKFEEFVRASDKKEPVCPKCGNRRISKLISGFGLSPGGCGSSSGGGGG